MDDNQKKYEEAAKASMQVWIDELQQRGEMVMSHGQQVYLRAFLAGASFAEKEAHNSAIDKVLSLIKLNKWAFDGERDFKMIVEGVEKLNL